MMNHKPATDRNHCYKSQNSMQDTVTALFQSSVLNWYIQNEWNQRDVTL